MELRTLDSRMTPKPQMPQDAVFSISNGIATDLRPHSMTAIALAPDKLQAISPQVPPTSTRAARSRIGRRFFMKAYPEKRGGPHGIIGWICKLPVPVMRFLRTLRFGRYLIGTEDHRGQAAYGLRFTHEC